MTITATVVIAALLGVTWAMHRRSGSLSREVAALSEQVRRTASALSGTQTELAREVERRRAATNHEALLTHRAHRQAAIATLCQRALAGAKGGVLASRAVEGVMRTLKGAAACQILERPGGSGAWRIVACAGQSASTPCGSTSVIGSGTFLARTLQSPWPVLARDLPKEDDSAELGEPSDFAVRGALCVAIPGKSGPGPTGLLCVTSPRPDAFGEEDGLFVHAIALVLAAAHSQGRVPLEPHEPHDASNIFKCFTESAAHGLNVARASVWLFNRTRTKIACTDLYTRDARRHGSGAELEAADYPSYFSALASEGTISAPDAQIDLRTAEFTASYLKPRGITAVLDVPIWINGEMVGVVCLEHVGGPRSWTPEDEEFAYLIGSLVARAVERRRVPGGASSPGRPEVAVVAA